MTASKRLSTAVAKLGPLRPWMKELAEWHAQEGTPGNPALLNMARELAKSPLSMKIVKAIVGREDWWAYREEIALDAMLQTRRRVERRAGEYVDAHYDAMKAAHAKVADNPKLVADITQPILDRVWAKKEERTPGATTIVINLGPQGSVQKVLDYEPLPVEIVASPTEDSA